MVGFHVSGGLHSYISGDMNLPLNLREVTTIVFAIARGIGIEGRLALIAIIHHMSQVGADCVVIITGHIRHTSTRGKATVGNIPIGIIRIIRVIILPVTERLIG